MQNPWKTALASIVLAGLPLAAGCTKINDEDPATETQEDGTVTLASVLGSTEGLGTISDTLGDSELASVLDGPASYTLLAPNDAAFEALGEAGEALMEEEQRPVLVAILRNHLLPGHLTPEAIEQAIADSEGPVTMTTLGDGNLTFSKSGDQLIVETEDRSSAIIAGSSTATGNGVVIPLDTVLMPVPDDGNTRDQ